MTNSTRSFLCLILVASISPAWAAEHVVQRFGKEPLNLRFLRRVGLNAAESIAQTPEGLKITIPFTAGTWAGFETQFALIGDFETTLQYHLVNVEKPNEGHGAGVVLRIFSRPGTQGSAGLAVRKKKDAAIAFGTVSARAQSDKMDLKSYPAQADHGRLRFSRSGSQLTFEVAEGDSAEFRQLQQVEFGSEPIRTIQVVADTGGSTQKMSVCLGEFSANADKIVFAIPPVERTSAWGIWIAAAIAAVLIAATSAWFVRRRRHG